MWLGMLRAGAQTALGGFDPFGGNRLDAYPDHGFARPGSRRAPIQHDGNLTFSKVDDVYHSGTLHEEDQPPHLLIQSAEVCTMCLKTFGGEAPCEAFCPANVYEKARNPGEGWKGPITLNAANCVHCKTCDIRDPFANITWVPPEGGGGPKYTLL
jgi:electron-transferring-flavoprotein dehydrogenase